MELEMIKGLQMIRNPILDFMAQLLTQLGDQYVFILIVATLYWLISKKVAFKMVFLFLMSSVTNEGLKAVIQRPRPYTETGVDSIGKETHGYSMPSGHSQASGLTSTYLYLEYKNRFKWLKYVLLVLITIVPLTRMYLGQHYLTDVIAGTLIGVLIAYFGSIAIDKMGKYDGLIAFFISLILTVTLLFLQNKAYVDVKNFFAITGAFLGFSIGYMIENHLNGNIYGAF